MITAIIVDDEPDCCESLATLLERYCPEIKVIDICYSGAKALDSIRQHAPQILFLDIQMPHMSGFDLLENLGDINFTLIFTTSYDQYAIKAIRFSAMDYLLKPIDREELQQSVQKVIHQKTPQIRQLEMLLQAFKRPQVPISKIAIPTIEGLQLIPVESVITCESEGNYTVIFLKSKHKIISSRSLKDFEEMLEDFPFIRVHHSFIVNLNEIDKYIRGEGGYLLMSDGSTINVSRSRKELLLKRLLP